MTKGHKIMVIDDDTAMRELLYSVLTKKGYEVTLAVGGEEAFQLMTKSKPDVIILDYLMPRMDGLTFLQRLRSFDTQMPVVMLTAIDSDELEHEAKKLGVYDFLRKGVGLELFIDSISKFVEPKRKPPQAETSRGTILVVDDDPSICDILKRFLTKKGYEITTAASAEKAISKVKERKPNLVLLDINFPAGMDGLTALKKLRQTDKDLSVIMISADTDMRLAREAITLGAADYIMKPFNLEYLELSVMTKIFLES
ncbi:MAG: response regulator [Planctomycetota bacterium]|nr:response regulator [Planctomycetota bacterium]MDI6788464.1 response regulator [Planctomycetota bacterium]